MARGFGLAADSTSRCRLCALPVLFTPLWAFVFRCVHREPDFRPKYATSLDLPCSLCLHDGVFPPSFQAP